MKVGRPGRTSGLSRVSVRVRVAGARASSYTVRTVLDGVLDATTRDGRDLRLQIGAHGLHGTVGDYTARMGKDAEQAKTNDIFHNLPLVLEQQLCTY